jgi:ferritin-like metal-binding protein YciE
MNVEFRQTLIIEELRNLCDADLQLSKMLPQMERASLSPEVRGSTVGQRSSATC